MDAESFEQSFHKVQIALLLSRLEHTIRVVGRLADRLAALQQHHLMLLGVRQNEKLQILTMASAIFLPLTLITGIYGMNFRYMPETDWQFGYPGVLALMGTIAAAIVGSFYAKGWFR